MMPDMGVYPDRISKWLVALSLNLLSIGRGSSFPWPYSAISPATVIAYPFVFLFLRAIMCSLFGGYSRINGWWCSHYRP